MLIAAGVDTADKAIEHGVVPEWSRLAQDAWPDYQTLRDSQESLALHIAPTRMWVSATPSIDGEDPANLLWFRNLPELWPDWRERGRTRSQINLTGPTPRPEPWPRPDGVEFLLWSFKAQAEHWIPTTKEFDETFGPNRQHFTIDDDDESQPDDDSSPYDSMLIGPLLVERERQMQTVGGDPASDTSHNLEERPQSFKGHPHHLSTDQENKMSALINHQNGQTFPTITTAMLATIATGLNKADTATFGGPPPVPHVLEAIVDAITALDQSING